MLPPHQAVLIGTLDNVEKKAQREQQPIDFLHEATYTASLQRMTGLLLYSVILVAGTSGVEQQSSRVE